MNKSIKYLNTLSKQFSDLAKELTPQELAKAMRGGIWMEAKRIRDKARDKAMETAAAHQLKVNDTFREGIRMTVPKNLTGFEITTVPKKGKGYKTGKGGLKPIALWADTGTDERNTSTFKIWGGKRISKYKILGGRKMTRKRKGHYTGKMMGKKGGALKFMESTERTELPGAETRISKNMGDIVVRIALKKLKWKGHH